MEKFPTSSTHIRFQDCDPFGHLNNSQYIDYFFNAREDQLIKYYALNIFDFAKTYGKGWVVGKNEIIYIKPATLMEEVNIRTTLIGYTKNSLHMEGMMYNKENTHVKAVLRTRFVHINLKEGRSTDHDETLLNFFASVQIDPSIEQFSLDERVTQIMNELKVAV